MKNLPAVKIGIVAVSRDCFPEELAVNRRKAVVESFETKYGKGILYECPITIVESEIDMEKALADLKKENCNALVVYLGNFGPEISETMLAERFDREVGPVMFAAAAEENIAVLSSTRGEPTADFSTLPTISTSAALRLTFPKSRSKTKKA